MCKLELLPDYAPPSASCRFKLVTLSLVLSGLFLLPAHFEDTGISNPPLRVASPACTRVLSLLRAVLGDFKARGTEAVLSI